MAEQTLTLRTILNELYSSAAENKGEICRTTLSKGLRIEVKVEKDETFLRISRGKVEPSEMEWKTVLDNWPYPVMASPRKFMVDGRNYLSSSWPTQEQLL